MKKIQLTQGKFAIVDDEDYEWLSQWKWHVQWTESTKSFYAKRASHGKVVLMHRLIMNTPKGMVIDHINHDTLDNRRENLRNCTSSQNNTNRGVQSNNQLREKCISTHGSGFRVRVQKDRRFVFRKSFQTLAEAIKARDEAIKKFHGEYGYLSGENSNEI